MLHVNHPRLPVMENSTRQHMGRCGTAPLPPLHGSGPPGVKITLFFNPVSPAPNGTYHFSYTAVVHDAIGVLIDAHLFWADGIRCCPFLMDYYYASDSTNLIWTYLHYVITQCPPGASGQGIRSMETCPTPAAASNPVKTGIQ